MKPQGFTIAQHDAAGLTLWTVNNDLAHVRNILFIHLPHTRHPRIFQAIDRANDELFSLRNNLDNIVAREADKATDLYFRGSRKDTPDLYDTPPAGCSEKQFRDLTDRLNSLRFSNKRKPGRLECREKKIISETLRQDCLALLDLGERLEIVKYPLKPAFKAIRAFIELLNSTSTSEGCCKEVQ